MLVTSTNIKQWLNFIQYAHLINVMEIVNHKPINDGYS